MRKLNILVASSEMTPYAKTGGLGDVLGALPAAMAKRGHRVAVFIPHYGSLQETPGNLLPLNATIKIPIESQTETAQVAESTDKKTGLRTYLIGNSRYFHRKGLYGDPFTGEDFPDNDERFVFFCRAVLETARKINFAPDVVHVHDWQAGLIAVYLKALYADDDILGKAKSVLTIHNLAHQGTFPKERFSVLGLPRDLFYATGPFEFYGRVNLLKAAITYADKITTVSPRYAMEIQTEKFGAGLQGVLKLRSSDLTGILNGVDYTVWSPSRDKRLPNRYRPANLSGKRMNKVELLGTAGLPIRDKTPLIGLISRLVHQKGMALIEKAAERLFTMNIQMLVLGLGEQKYQRMFDDLQARYPDKLRVYLELNEDLAHQIEAAADMFLMPSLFEPCGLNQLYSLKYGTIPIVHDVGGLADTITDYDPQTGQGTGFVFHQETPDALLTTVERAVQVFGKKRAWTRIMLSLIHI